MDEKERLKIFEWVGAIITNSHIVYASDKHGREYVNKDAIYPHVAKTSLLCKEIAEHFGFYNVEVVAGPSIGGVILVQWVAHWLNLFRSDDVQLRRVLAVYAEEEGEGDQKIRVFKRGYDKLIPGKRVLAVEDVLTTGGSAKRVIEAVRKLGGEVVGLGVLCNRGGVRPEDVGINEIFALVNLSMESWPAGECPLCNEGVLINTEVGKGRDFVAQYGQPKKKAKEEEKFF